MEIFANKQRKRFPLQKINNNDGIFEIKKCKCGCAGDLEEGNEIMYIGAKKDDNGFMKMVTREDNLVTKGNCIVFICDGEGSVGYSNYMDKDFIGSTTLSVGYNENLNAYIGMFLVTFLDLERSKYSYGRKYGTNLGNAKIKLPIDDYGNPDRNFMESYIKSLNYKPITTKNKPGKNILNIDERKNFTINNIFSIEQTKGGISEDLLEGNDIPYIAAKYDQNGFVMMCQKEGFENRISLGNCVIFIQLGAGSAGYCNYIKDDFIGMTGKTSCGYIKGIMNQYIGLFLATVLSLERPKYSFGRSWTGKRLENTIIKLPIKRDQNGNPVIDEKKQFSNEGYIPDREFMENYIKNLPYGDRI